MQHGNGGHHLLPRPRYLGGGYSQAKLRVRLENTYRAEASPRSESRESISVVAGRAHAVLLSRKLRRLRPQSAGCNATLEINLSPLPPKRADIPSGGPSANGRLSPVCLAIPGQI